MQNSIVKTLQELGYSNAGDNRNFYVRSINSLIDAGILTLDIIRQDSDNCFLKPNRNGTQYLATIFGKRYFGHQVFFTRILNGEPVDIRPNEVNLAKMLQHVTRIASKNKDRFADLKIPNCECGKCSGHGRLPEFAYYADGICFECGGTGIDKSILKSHFNS